MLKPRVLVVDDSVVVRRLVSRAIEGDGELELAGVAASGPIALAKIPQTSPDAVVLDVEMEGMDGLETLVRIRRDYPRIPVIMFSAHTTRGASITLDALFRGANDCVLKPERASGPDESIQRIRDELLTRIKSICAHAPAYSDCPAARTPDPVFPSRYEPIQAVVIGSSTGGPNALADVLQSFSEPPAVPLLIVQHMPPLFTRFLAERLENFAHIPVREAEDGEDIHGGRVYLAPGGKHLRVVREDGMVRARLSGEAPENSCRPSVDVLFRSAAAVYGPRLLGAVLTGMGSDGLRGGAAIREAGGQLWAQDRTSSVVWGMPGFVVNAGLAGRVLPLCEMGPALAAAVHSASMAGSC